VRDETAAGYLAPHGLLRVSINLGNPVLAQGTPDEPHGVTVDIAREIAARLGAETAFRCFDAARHSFEATVAGETDLCFLAIEPAREAEIAFTPAYVVIDGAFAVPLASDITTVAEVDRPGVRVGVKQGSAYDLYLSRTLEYASVVRGPDGITVFRDRELDVAAGIRAPLAAHVAADPGLRLIDEPFMQIRQALGTRHDAPAAARTFLRELVEELKASGFVAAALTRSRQTSAAVAPPD
jgi:polar amino acid transport system substrate-binding protein